MRRARYALGLLCLRALVWAVGRLSLRGARRLGEALGAAAWMAWWPQRRRVMGNLARALPQLSPAERRRIACAASRHFARSFVETVYCAVRSAEELVAQMRAEGVERLRAALSAGRGALLVSAHLGGFTLLEYRLRREGIPAVGVVKDPPDPGIAAMFQQLRRRLGLETIPALPRQQATREILRALRQGKAVCLMVDEYKRRGGVMVEFFGQPVPVAAGPALLAQRARAPLVPVFLLREGEGYRLRVAEPLQPEGDPPRVMQRLIRVIEGEVRDHPEQWSWANNHWKPPKRLRRRWSSSS